MLGPEVRARVGAQFVGQPRPQRLVGGQRVGGATGGPQRRHQPADELFVQGVGGDQFLQFADHLGARAQLQIGIDPVAQRGQAFLLPTGQ